MAVCLIGLGSNLGDRKQILGGALRHLAGDPRVRLTSCSRWLQTMPIGGPPDQGPFLNGAAVLETSLSPQGLLALLQSVEAELGRRRTEHWGPRPIDLDLLLYGDLILQTDALSIPHPRMAWRRFVLKPAAEVAGSMVHPTIGWTIDQLLIHLNTALPYVALTGPVGAGTTDLAKQLARRIGASLILEQASDQPLGAFHADSSGNAWAVELEFVFERARLLEAGLPEWSDRKRIVVSDFWFSQFLVFAEVCLSPADFGVFSGKFAEASQGVVRPKLIVLLDTPTNLLLQRIRQRKHRYEGLTAELLERFRQAIVNQATRPGQGPVLRLSEDDPDRVLVEVLAAIEAMR